jgi:hypothetical protein
MGRSIRSTSTRAQLGLGFPPAALPHRHPGCSPPSHGERQPRWRGRKDRRMLGRSMQITPSGALPFGHYNLAGYADVLTGLLSVRWWGLSLPSFGNRRLLGRAMFDVCGHMARRPRRGMTTRSCQRRLKSDPVATWNPPVARGSSLKGPDSVKPRRAALFLAVGRFAGAPRRRAGVKARARGPTAKRPEGLEVGPPRCRLCGRRRGSRLCVALQQDRAGAGRWAAVIPSPRQGAAWSSARFGSRDQSVFRPRRGGQTPCGLARSEDPIRAHAGAAVRQRISPSRSP